MMVSDNSLNNRSVMSEKKIPTCERSPEAGLEFQACSVVLAQCVHPLKVSDQRAGMGREEILITESLSEMKNSFNMSETCHHSIREPAEINGAVWWRRRRCD